MIFVEVTICFLFEDYRDVVTIRTFLEWKGIVYIGFEGVMSTRDLQ